MSDINENTENRIAKQKTETTKNQTNKYGHTHEEVHELIHSDSKKIINRMSRLIGHMEAVKKMVEEGRDCTEILIQIAAVKSALNNVGKLLLIDHMNHCVFKSIENGDTSEMDSLLDAMDKFVK